MGTGIVGSGLLQRGFLFNDEGLMLGEDQEHCIHGWIAHKID